jgi:hypothetical protein
VEVEYRRMDLTTVNTYKPFSYLLVNFAHLELSSRVSSNNFCLMTCIPVTIIVIAILLVPIGLLLAFVLPRHYSFHILTLGFV